MPKPVALVTGGSRGIGRAISERLAQDGFVVAVNFNRDVEAAKEVAARIEDAMGEVHLVQADVSAPAQVEAMFAEVEASAGSVEVLVNNAGTRIDGLTISMTDEAFDRVLRTNLYGPFYCARRALRSMIRARSGRIVNVSSVAGLSGSPGQANYAAAKAGLIGLTRTLAREVGRKGVTVNAVAPGLVDTELTSGLTPQQRDRILQEVPAARAGRVEEIAAAISYLCSEAAEYVNGSVLVIDGAMTS